MAAPTSATNALGNLNSTSVLFKASDRHCNFSSFDGWGDAPKLNITLSTTPQKLTDSYYQRSTFIYS
ncbi:hypothetical protein I8748_20840 [Nostoc sp. CENA67]|uniref:Uncharacterized protein n=1 Tax=Amazonocrinis nigriterrae CENA67 TaxID=2794033 RepID=A0A8J7HUS9_9NOST|nr:hypothetical protein [Amazonocrinis nigriterrae]MBH8564600.1 hypothetical protein [Amazonocrinis nigriterrae CENA67]